MYLLLCTSFSFATHHVIYGAHAAMSAPTIAFVLISPVHTDKKGTNRIHHTLHISLYAHTLPHACTHTLPHTCTLPCAHTSHHAHTCTCTLPPSSLSYLFTPLALLSGCIQLNSALLHSFSPIITDTPITLHTPAHLLTFVLVLHLCSLALCTHT